MPRVELYVAGSLFAGWESVTVSRSLEAVSGSFELRVSSRNGWPIPPGARARLELEGEPIVDGYVDSVEVFRGATEHTFTVQGRDKTADLVDCSAMIEPGEWLDVDLARIAQDVANPYGVSLGASEADPGEPFSRFSLQPGETAWEALERACRLRGMLATTNGRGELVLARPGGAAAETTLALGSNILAARLSMDQSQRFGRYVVRGQHPGGDDLLESHISGPEGEASDALARASRALLILSEGITTPDEAAERAAWEATYRAARAASLEVTVQGWRQRAGGRLWTLNELVPVLAPGLGISGKFLVSGVTYGLAAESGETTTLQLVRPDAYTPQPDLPPEGDPVAAFLAKHGLDLELDEEDE